MSSSSSTSRNPNGRRGKPEAQRRPVFARFRCTTAEYDALCREAFRSRMTISEYLRARLLKPELVTQT